MSEAPLMPMATAVWLVENTSLTFKQIADFCKMHEVEIQGIADGEVGKGIVGQSNNFRVTSKKKLNYLLKTKRIPETVSSEVQIKNNEIKIKNIFLYQKDKINQTQLYG